ncbi:MAG: hypothetical protein ACRDGV_11100 [Candidatus Limnocylindria bacterium]
MTETQRPAGYRGSLPERNDRLARTWVLIVGGIFVLIFVLSALGVPSRLIPDPTPIPVPTLPPASGTVEGQPSPTESPAESPVESPAS